MIIGLCRFSYLAVRGWQSVPSNIDEARDYLFDKARLDFRFALFERYTLPSLKLQTDGDFRFLILTSADLPANYQDRLNDIIGDDRRIAVHALPPRNKNKLIRQMYFDELGSERDLISFRIDDDDGLSVDFIRRLREEIAIRRSDRPFFVSFSSGIVVNYGGETIDWASQCSYPFLSNGLALSDPRPNKQCVYDFAHMKCYQEFDAVLLAGAPAYVRCVHDFNDSRGLAWGAKGFEQRSLADLAREFRQEFPYLAAE